MPQDIRPGSKLGPLHIASWAHTGLSYWETESESIHLDCVKTSSAAATEHINTDVDVVHATDLTRRQFWLLQVWLFPAVVEKYTIADVKEEPGDQN